jgi:hypothetical protein
MMAAISARDRAKRQLMPAGWVGGSGPGSGGAAPRGNPAPPAAMNFLFRATVSKLQAILQVVIWRASACGKHERPDQNTLK